jgi:hypothetical protein
MLSGSSFAHLELTQYICKIAIRRDSSLLLFSQAIRFPAPFLVDEFGCGVSALSTLSTSSTSSTLSLPNGPRKPLDYVLLSIPSGLVCDLPLDEECNRMTDAPETDETTLWPHSLQPSSVPVQARPWCD